MIILVTGAEGVLGRRVVEDLAGRAHAVRAMTTVPGAAFPAPAEPVAADLETGRGVPDAVDGADVVIHCAVPNRTRSFLDGTAMLVENAVRAGVTHLIRPGRVGSDVIPDRRHRAEQAVERAIAGSGLGWSVRRHTPLHQEVWNRLARLARGPIVVVPNDTRLQPMDVATVARLAADAAESPPGGRLPDIGGPHAYEVRDLARSWLAANGLHKPIVRLNRWGLAGAAMRAGASLTPNRDTHGAGWNDYVRSRLDARS